MLNALRFETPSQYQNPRPLEHPSDHKYLGQYLKPRSRVVK
jgi:hypothetical protein